MLKKINSQNCPSIKFVAEYQEKGVTKIVFVESEKNKADIMAKNLGSELHIKNIARLFESE